MHMIYLYYLKHRGDDIPDIEINMGEYNFPNRAY